MTLWQMSVSGAALIAVIFLLRTAALHRLPKRMFVLLWMAVALRLLIPAAVPFAYGVWSMAEGGGWLRPAETEEISGRTDAEAGEAGQPGQTAGTVRKEAEDGLPGGAVPETGRSGAGSEVGGSGAALEDGGGGVPDTENRKSKNGPAGRGVLEGRPFPWRCVWIAGCTACVLFFTAVYLRERRELCMALPVENETVQRWQEASSLRRPLRLGQSDRIGTPLTYGVLRPVILLPKQMHGADEQTLLYVLEHELVHVRRFDSLAKLFMTAAACVHWFNPLVWVMYVLFNRDVELACDEAVLRRLGGDRRRAYAMTLIGLEELRGRRISLASGFGKNGMEERITAIMKRKRISLAALTMAVLLVAGAFLMFGTTAEPKRVQASAPDAEFTREEWEMLTALQPAGFMDMTVREYQELVGGITDTPEYSALFERLSADEALYDKRDETDMAGFISYILMPLTGDHWHTREFGGCAAVSYQEQDELVPLPETEDSGRIQLPADAENAVLEYFLTLKLTDRDRMTVGGYKEARETAAEELRTFFFERSREELETPEIMNRLLMDAVRQIGEKWSRDGLELEITFYFVPLTSEAGEELQLRSQSESETRAEWDRLLAPYAALGLSWEYEREEDAVPGIRMYWQGQEVRGIYDSVENTWISEHSGGSTYGPEAIELIAVYEDGLLTGLRPADEEEQAFWDEVRENSRDENASQDGEREREARLYPYGTQEDYRSLFQEVMTGDWQELRLSEFNDRLLAWCNAHDEAMERIGTDAFLDDYQVSLSEEEQSFAAVTMDLSRGENYRWVTSLNTGSPREDNQVGGGSWLTKERPDGSWCQMRYWFSYHIEDFSRVTVKERDRAVCGMVEKIEAFWNENSLDVLRKMSREEVAEIFRGYAKECSTDGIRISIEESEVQFEHR